MHWSGWTENCVHLLCCSRRPQFGVKQGNGSNNNDTECYYKQQLRPRVVPRSILSILWLDHPDSYDSSLCCSLYVAFCEQLLQQMIHPTPAATEGTAVSQSVTHTPSEVVCSISSWPCSANSSEANPSCTQQLTGSDRRSIPKCACEHSCELLLGVHPQAYPCTACCLRQRFGQCIPHQTVQEISSSETT